MGQVAFSVCPGLPAVWMVLPPPSPGLWGSFVIFVFCFCFVFNIKMPGLITNPQPPTAVIYLSVNTASLLLLYLQ